MHIRVLSRPQLSLQPHLRTRNRSPGLLFWEFPRRRLGVEVLRLQMGKARELELRLPLPRRRLVLG